MQAGATIEMSIHNVTIMTGANLFDEARQSSVNEPFVMEWPYSSNYHADSPILTHNILP